MTAHIRRILDFFETVSRIPRCSKNEDAIARWLEAWAGKHGWPAGRDRAGNLLIAVPPSPGAERAPGAILQGHLDMVCEKTPESAHDFSRDPIRFVRDGDWIGADGTTLGADNGVALALAAALAEERTVTHPRLELLFTVDEESGLSGAKHLAPGWLSGRILINLDSETEGVFTVGCAGGRDMTLSRALAAAPLADGFKRMRLTVGGLRGGHSGIDIHRRRANATRLLARTLDALIEAHPVQLLSLGGGTRHNAIPRDAAALIASAPENEAGFRRQAAAFSERFRAEFPEETGLFVTLSDAEPSAAAGGLSPADARAALKLLLALPHGVLDMSPDFPDLVLTSNTLAVAQIAEGRLSVLTSQRSLTAAGLDTASETVRAVSALAGAQAAVASEYPPWTPNFNSPLLARSRELYRGLFGSDPQVRAIHAGLECALIGGTYPGMDMISFGPTTENAHSPSERLYVPSLARLWDFLAALLKSLGTTV
jgi:dipeptidase D